MKQLLIASLVASVMSMSAQAGDLKVGAQLFTDFGGHWVDNNTSQNTVGFNITRAYLKPMYKFDENWSAGMTADFGSLTATSSTSVTVGGVAVTTTSAANTGYLEGFVKFAWFRYSGAWDMMDFTFGQIPTYWAAYADDVWGHSYAYNSVAHLNGAVNVADRGADFTFHFQDMADLTVQVTNGGGQRYNVSTANDKFLGYSGRLTFTPMTGNDDWKMTQFSIGGELNPGRSTGNVNDFANTFNLLLGIGYMDWMFAAELAAAGRANGVDPMGGWSLYLHGPIANDFGFGLRFDNWDPSTNITDNNVQTWIVGLTYDFMDNIQGGLWADRMARQNGIDETDIKVAFDVHW